MSTNDSGPGGGGVPSIQELLQTAQRMQQDLAKVQSALAQMTVEGSAGGGMVVATANGRQQLLALRIEREVVDQNEIPMLQDLIVAAVNQALAKASELAQQEMARVTGQNLKLEGFPF
jgi:DNA-binding YbaB/EbfC family protein